MSSETRGLSSATLHILAMTFMLCDHVWSTLLPNYEILTCIGRLAYPLFAFMLVEGFFHTRDIKRYAMRMFAFAVVSEVPFDLVYAGIPFYPYHQNVLWTFLIALGIMFLMEKIKAKGKLWLTILVDALLVIAGFLVGMATMVDYYGIGILMVLVFYFFRGRKWWCFAGQLVCMWYLNVEVLGGYYYDITVLGHHIELVQQSLALLTLIPIWLYRGKQGYHAKWFKYFCYAFYPGHLLLLYLIGVLL